MVSYMQVFRIVLGTGPLKIAPVTHFPEGLSRTFLGLSPFRIQCRIVMLCVQKRQVLP